ncbi:helix-turn-helix domain-containing protein [Gordonia sp. CPCC 205515]|uniref:helix-turn-helix domain-containing protein n=1 Tax=Gordonia sp. CPCC 205515 TaxID=3140791 RepID=UPI003AF35342
MTVWDVADVSVRDRFAYWHDVLCTAFVPLRPTMEVGERPFAGRVESRPMGPMVRSVLSSHPQSTAHGPQQVSATDGEYYFLNRQLQGSCRVRQRGVDVVVGAGQIVLVDTTEPYWFDQDEDWSIMSFRLPKSVLDDRCNGVTPQVATPLPENGAGAVVGALMSALWHVDAESIAAGEMTDAVAAALAAHHCALPVAPSSTRQARRTEVLRYLRTHLADPGLSVEMAARDLHVSPRTLHAAFDDTDDTFIRTLRHMRLRRAADLLADSTRVCTVTEVAAMVGFADPSTFTRAFRRQFGITPADMRRRALHPAQG